MEFVVGGLTAVCTSLVVVLLLWRLSRHFFLRATPPPCCDVTDLLAWLLDACQAVMGAAILVLVVSDDVTCAVAGFLAMFGGAQTLCLLAARAVVTATGHVVRDEPRDLQRMSTCDGSSKLADKHCTAVWPVALLISQVSVVTVFCVLPLSQLPVAATPQRNHTEDHLTCLPLTLESRDTAAWHYSCFLLVAVCWFPLLVAGTTGISQYACRTHAARSRKAWTRESVWWSLSGALRLLFWAAVVALVSVEVLMSPSDSRRAAVQLAVALGVDAAMLMHVVVVSQAHHHRHHDHQYQQHELPARLTVITRAQQQLVRS